jgi:C-terminal processing protease CtpA/Prc
MRSLPPLIKALAASLIIAFGLAAQSSEVDRLAKLGEVWFKAKYFHPSLAYRELDWLAPLSKAIPAAKAAKTPQEFGAAVELMLAALGDPATHVEPPPGQKDNSPSPEAFLHWHKEEDGILVAGVHPFGTPVRNGYGPLMSEIRASRGLILDLRLPPGADSARKWFLDQPAGPISVLVSSPVSPPSRRRVVHHGLPRSDLIESGYYSAFETVGTVAFQPLPQIKDCPTVFLLNQYSPWPDFAAAMVAAGKATAVFEGAGSLNHSTATMRIPLESGWSALIRLEEQVFADGSGTPAPGLRVAEGKGIERALAALRQPANTTVEGKRLPAAPVFRETAASISSANPYPPVSGRLAAAFQIWGIFEYFFPHRSLMEEDWTGVLKQFIPRMEMARDALDYHLAVAEMCAFVRDSHLQMPASNVLGRHFLPVAGRAPGMPLGGVQIRIMEGLPVVWRVRPDIAGRISAGEIVRRVDGEDAALRLDRLRKYISASTPQAMQRHLANLFLAGPDETEAKIELEDAQGGRRTVMLARSGRPVDAVTSQAPPPVQLIDERIGYLDLGRVGAGQVAGAVERLQNSKALIVDIRQSGGSFAHIGVLQRLLGRRGGSSAIFRTPVLTGQSIGNSTDVARLHSVEQDFYQPVSKSAYAGKIALLMDETAQSQLEGLAYVLRTLCDATIIGGPSTGSNGNATNFVVPGGLRIGLTGTQMKYLGPTGEIQQQRVGLQPDIKASPTIAGIRAGRDEVLERAIEFLTTGK